MPPDLHAAIARELPANQPQEQAVNPTEETAPLAATTPPPMTAPPLSGKRVAFEYLTVRELFAAQALQGVIASHSGETALPDEKKAAKWSREFADALLAELSNYPSA